MLQELTDTLASITENIHTQAIHCESRPMTNISLGTLIEDKSCILVKYVLESILDRKFTWPEFEQYLLNNMQDGNIQRLPHYIVATNDDKLDMLIQSLQQRL